MHYASFELVKKVVFKSNSCSLPFVQTFLFERTPIGTRLTGRPELQMSSQVDLDRPMIASGIKRAADGNFGILKELLENHGKPVESPLLPRLF